MTQTTGNAPTINMQGIDVPVSSIDAATFFANTRRKRFNEQSISSFAGFGESDQFTIKQSGIIAALDVHVAGSLVVTLGDDMTCASTWRWPYDLIKKIILTANGTTNLVSCSGAKLAAYRLMSNPGLTDRGVPQSVNDVTVYQGTLSLAGESWGVGQAQTAIEAGAYDVDLFFRIPLAADLIKLLGAVFGQTQATSLNVEIDWNNLSSLFTLVGGATVAFSPSVVCEGIVFSIPYGPTGQIVIPNLSAYHKFIEYLDFAVGAGQYGSTLVGQGVGQLLNRVMFRLWNGATPNANVPVPIEAANYGLIGWQYGGDQFPEAYGAAGDGVGHMLRNWDEELYGSDIGAQGIGCLDFASQWLTRDSVDESTATNLQLIVTPTVDLLAAKVLEVVQETISAGSGMYGSSGT